MKVTIKSVKDNDSVVEFVFDDGIKSTQTIAGIPLNDEATASEFLKGYAEAYLAGKKTAESLVDNTLIGKQITID